MADTSTLGKLLIVDDDSHIVDLLVINLRSEGYDASAVSTAKEAIKLDLRDYRLIIVDAYNQEYSGFDFLEDVRSNPMLQHVGVMLYSLSDRENDIIHALDSGVDDYIIKPFSLREMIARIRSVLRRHPLRQQPSTGAKLTFADIEIDLLTGKVTSDGMLISLSKTEYAILVLLMKNIDNFVSRIRIHKEVWKEGESANERIVDTNISRLRKKLGETGQKIINRSGLGYMLTEKKAV